MYKPLGSEELYSAVCGMCASLLSGAVERRPLAARPDENGDIPSLHYSTGAIPCLYASASPVGKTYYRVRIKSEVYNLTLQLFLGSSGVTSLFAGL